MSTETMADFEGQLDVANPWNIVTDYMNKKTKLTLKVEGVVNGGVIVKVEGLRGFVPASRLSLSFVENLETYLLKEIQVIIIDADQANNKLVLSSREILKAEQDKERRAAIDNVVVGSVTTGVVENLPEYGAFVRLQDGLSGLVHVSQISYDRIKSPSVVLSVGQEVDVKIIGVNDGKISLSIKALIEDPNAEEIIEDVEIPACEDLNTNLGDLFKNIQL